MSAKLRRRLTFVEMIAVQRALAGGTRHVEIAREFDLGVWTVDRIAAQHPNEVPADELPQDDAPPDYDATRLGRCPGCGGMVYVWPCIACRMATAERVAPAEEVVNEEEESAERLNYKQRRRRRREVVQRVFGKAG